MISLEAFALGQGGYFNRRDARSFGLTDPLLHHHTQSGRFDRALPGVYRLWAAPVSPYDEQFAACVWTNYRGAISHESALALFGLIDVPPLEVHITVPRPFHRTSGPFHVHLAPLPQEEVQTHYSVRVTTPARAIMDAAATNMDAGQFHTVVDAALARGLFTPETLRAVVARQPNQHRRDVRPLIESALARADRATEQDADLLS